MGTRSLTFIFDKKPDTLHYEKPLVVIYKQYDGYPTSDGIGGSIVELIKGAKLVNGISYGEKSKVYNGMGDFAATAIKFLKVDIGGVYIVSPHNYRWYKECGDEQEYNYFIYPDGDEIVAECLCNDEECKIEGL